MKRKHNYILGPYHNNIVIVKVTIKDKSPSYLRYDDELGVVKQVEHLKQVVIMSIHLSLL